MYFVSVMADALRVLLCCVVRGRRATCCVSRSRRRRVTQSRLGYPLAGWRWARVLRACRTGLAVPAEPPLPSTNERRPRVPKPDTRAEQSREVRASAPGVRVPAQCVCAVSLTLSVYKAYSIANFAFHFSLAFRLTCTCIRLRTDRLRLALTVRCRVGSRSIDFIDIYFIVQLCMIYENISRIGEIPLYRISSIRINILPVKQCAYSFYPVWKA